MSRLGQSFAVQIEQAWDPLSCTSASRRKGLAVARSAQLPEQSAPTYLEHAGHIVGIEFTLAQHLPGSGDVGWSHFAAPATDPAYELALQAGRGPSGGS
jgi:hypothetical protein